MAEKTLEIIESLCSTTEIRLISILKPVENVLEYNDPKQIYEGRKRIIF